MTSGSVVFFQCLQFSGSYSYVFNKGAVPTVLNFLHCIQNSNFDISFRLPRILNAAEHIS